MGFGCWKQFINSAGVGRSDSADDGVDSVAISDRILVAFEDHRGGAFAKEWACPIHRVAGRIAQNGAEIGGEIDRADEGLIEFAALEGADAQFERAQAGSLFV